MNSSKQARYLYPPTKLQGSPCLPHSRLGSVSLEDNDTPRQGGATWPVAWRAAPEPSEPNPTAGTTGDWWKVLGSREFCLATVAMHKMDDLQDVTLPPVNHIASLGIKTIISTRICWYQG